jgi:hypothetical protein
VRGARLVPESVDLSRASIDSAGVARGLVDGVRFLSRARGSVFTAKERLLGLGAAVALPPRLGAGYLFVVGDTVYKADDWLGDPEPLFRSARGVLGLFAGLDRVYVRTTVGHVGLDATSGAVLDLGAWPPDPFVHAYVAFDGWRALALTDIRGAVATSNAGRSWDRLDLAMRAGALTPVHRDESSQGWVAVVPDGSSGSVDAIVVSDAALRMENGQAFARTGARCALVTPAFDVTPLPSCDVVRIRGPEERTPAAGREVGASLRAALTDGWPLANGTAVVADHGDLALVSLADGAVVDVAVGAYDASLGNCHAVSLGPAAFGFVCGGDSGKTALLEYETASGRLIPVKAFATPRIVQTSPRGGWLVRGPCGDVAGLPSPRSSAACVGSAPAGSAQATAWREVVIADAAGGALGLMSDGRVAEIVPSRAPGEATLRLTGADGATTVAHLALDRVLPRRALGRVVWVDDLEERSPGVIGGWLMLDDTVLGVEVQLDGSVRAGSYVRDLGSPFVAGRYGLGWTRGRLGYETTDGGMTWAHFDAPAALAPSRTRACGPSGCVADGWLRVGWGERAIEPPARLDPAPRTRAAGAGPWRLACRRASAPVATDDRDADGGLAPRERTRRGEGAGHEESAFPPPSIAPGDARIQVDAYRGFDYAHRLGALARIYAWGPSKREWAGRGRWEVRWRSPFADPLSGASSALTGAPFADLEGARADLGIGRGPPATWTVVVAEDGAHALLMARRGNGARDLFSLDEGGQVVPLLRADGEPWGAVSAALRAGPDWFLAQPDEARQEAVALYRAGGGGPARRFALVDRRGSVGVAGVAEVKLARESGGRAIGLVVDGERLPDRNTAQRWVVPVEVDSGDVGAPEPLGAADLGDAADVTVCSDTGVSGAGWVFETLLPDARIQVSSAETGERASLRQVYGRVRISGDRVCLDRLTGEAPWEPLEHSDARSAPRPAVRSAQGDVRSLPVLLVGDSPALFRCELWTK